MKKLFITLSLLGTLLFNDARAAGLITTNLSSGTNVIWTGRKSVYQIDVASGTANLAVFYDTSSNALTYVVGAYTGSSNVAGKTVTTLQTNAIFEYATITQYMIQTNVSLSGAYRTNYAVVANTNGVRPSVTLYVPAGTVASLDAVDLNFTLGITVTLTNSAQVNIYTRD